MDELQLFRGDTVLLKVMNENLYLFSNGKPATRAAQFSHFFVGAPLPESNLSIVVFPVVGPIDSRLLVSFLESLKTDSEINLLSC